MAERYEVIVRVVSQKGKCAFDYKVGDEWVFRKQTPSKSMCLFALQAVLPAIFVMMFGGSFNWERDPDVITNQACIDAKNPVVFEIQRGPRVV
jgi:uncharacterized repeat protein (TIGR04076 family)